MCASLQDIARGYFKAKFQEASKRAGDLQWSMFRAERQVGRAAGWRSPGTTRHGHGTGMDWFRRGRLPVASRKPPYAPPCVPRQRLVNPCSHLPACPTSRHSRLAPVA
jgi:hypothetical protein